MTEIQYIAAAGGVLIAIIVATNAFIGRRLPAESTAHYKFRAIIFALCAIFVAVFMVRNLDHLTGNGAEGRECQTGRNPALRALDVNNCDDWATRP